MSSFIQFFPVLYISCILPYAFKKIQSNKGLAPKPSFEFAPVWLSQPQVGILDNMEYKPTLPEFTIATRVL